MNNKELTRVERIIVSITEIADVLSLTRIECAKELYKRDMYDNINDKMIDFSKAIVKIMIEDEVKPSMIDNKVISRLIDVDTELFRTYYDGLEEKYKVQIICSITNIAKIFNEYRRPLTYMLISNPTNLLTLLTPSRITANTSNAMLYEFIENNAEFLFKYIDLQKLTERYYGMGISLSTVGDNYALKAIIKRISMYQEKKITKPNVIKFIDYLNDNKNNVCDEARKEIMDALNTYLPDKIMVDILL